MQNTNKIWFSSDHHFGHNNIIKFCNRPFSSIKEHDETLIDNWNRVVKSDHVVYYLGDFVIGSAQFTRKIVERLNGKIHFIKGNHDKVVDKNIDIQKMFASYQTYLEIKISHEQLKKGHKVILFHFPIETWHKKHFGSYHLHGHSHGNVDSDETKNRVDVGVDVWDYHPVSLEQIIEHMLNKQVNI